MKKILKPMGWLSVCALALGVSIGLQYLTAWGFYYGATAWQTAYWTAQGSPTPPRSPST